MVTCKDGTQWPIVQALVALRNGVPNREAVNILGCIQPDVEGNLDNLLHPAIDADNTPETSLGMLVSGDFGSGKSHLLSYFEHRALEREPPSRIAVSKDNPVLTT